MRYRLSKLTIDLPHLNKIAPAIRNSKILLSKRSRRNRVRTSSTSRRLGEEELLDDGAGIVNREGGYVAWDGGCAGSRSGVHVSGCSSGGDGEHDFVGPVGGGICVGFE